MEDESELLGEVMRARPRRVTVLLEDAPRDWSDETVVRDRLANLLTAIEERTGATVVGLAGDRAQLLGWRFDDVIAAATPVAA
jgi:hypothetical protein